MEVGTKTYCHQSCQTDLSYNEDDCRQNESSFWEQDSDVDDWHLTDEDDIAMDKENNSPCSSNSTPHQEIKCLVFHSQLELLTSVCNTCGRQQMDKKVVVCGTAVTISFDCECGAEFRWTSQPCSGTLPYGNLLLAGSIMFSGGSPFQMLNMLQHLNVASISKRTYFRIQQLYLVPCIRDVFVRRQQQLFSAIRESCSSVRVAGNARCCSPGHTAKYGSYSLLDLNTGKILDTQLVQVSAQVLHQVNFSHLFSSIRLSFFLCLDSDDSLGCEMHVN